MNNEIEFKFGDYAIIEQKRHGAPNEMYVYKVIGQLRSNKWVDVPVWGVATEILHKELDDVCLCIRCGIDETVVHRYRVKDMQRSSRSPDGGEDGPASVANEIRSLRDLRDTAIQALKSQVEQLATENVALKEDRDTLARYWIEDGGDKDCAMSYCEPTPATDRIVAGIKADGRVEGAHFVANRMLAAWDAGFIEDSAKNAADIARMILTSTEFMADAPEGYFDRSFADDILADIAKQLREGADK